MKLVKKKNREKKQETLCISFRSFYCSPRILVDLLKMNVAPQAVFQTLKAMCAGQRVAENGSSMEASTTSQTTSVTAAPTEARGQWLYHQQVVIWLEDTTVAVNKRVHRERNWESWGRGSRFCSQRCVCMCVTFTGSNLFLMKCWTLRIFETLSFVMLNLPLLFFLFSSCFQAWPTFTFPHLRSVGCRFSFCTKNHLLTKFTDHFILSRSDWGSAADDCSSLHAPLSSALSNFFSVPLEFHFFFSCKEEDTTLVSGKSPKLPATPPTASGPRATRVNTKIVVYGPQDSSSPHSQGSLWCTFSHTSICQPATACCAPISLL